MAAAKKPRWEPTKDQLDQIEFLAGFDWSRDRIGRFLGVSGPTLTRAAKKNAALRDRLLKGKESVNASLLQSTFEMALSKKFPAINIFLLKVRLGFKDPNAFSNQPGRGGLLHEGATGDIDQKKADEVVDQFKGLLAEYERIPRDETHRVETIKPKSSDDRLPENES